MACERLEKPSSDAQIIAKGWGVEYEKMSASQQLYAKKFIDDILFEGRLGNLDRHSITINNPPQSIATPNHPQYIHPPGYIPFSHARSAPSTPFNSYPPIPSPSPSNVSTHSDSSQYLNMRASRQVDQIHESTQQPVQYSSIHDLLHDEQLN